MGGFPFIDKVPITRSSRVNRRAFEYRCRYSVGEGAVDDVCMPSDPSDIGHTCEFILGVNVKDVFHREQRLENVASGCVDDTFGFTGGSRCLHVSVDIGGQLT